MWFLQLQFIKDGAFFDVALSFTDVGGFLAYGHDVVVVDGGEVVIFMARCSFIWLQFVFELTVSRVFTLAGAEGMDSILCDQGVRPLLEQRSS
jgi:hypothetical protein